MEINKIMGETCKITRPLWEEVFYEDSIQFTDYYFENKAKKNIGYVIGQAPYDAMMFRTPYTLQIGETQKEISYIVGVATRKEYRHRGYMRELLMHSFREMYQEKNPFTFLMPANPAIYEPFDFKYIYERDSWMLKDQERVVALLESLSRYNIFEIKEKQEVCELKAAEIKGYDQKFLEVENEQVAKRIADELDGLYSIRKLRKQFPEFPILKILAEFANQYLKEHYKIYVHRDAAYYEMQLKESKAQNGDIYVLFERGAIQAFFLYAKEGDEVFIQEVMETEPGILDFLQKSETKKPIIMARIIHLEEMMKLVCSKEKTTMVIEIEDELIPENAGIFRWEMTPNGSYVTKIKSKNADVTPEASMHIRDFAPWILTKVFLNEIV